LIAVTLSLMFGIPAAALGGVPILLALRSRHIESARAFATAGAVLALMTYLVVAGTGLWRPEYQSCRKSDTIGTDVDSASETSARSDSHAILCVTFSGEGTAR
jgi:hypothetical protein